MWIYYFHLKMHLQVVIFIAFAMQMILILVTGYVLALTPPMKKVLDWVAEKADTPVKGTMIVALVGGVGLWINWGFGLIFAGLLAIEVARRNRKADFPALIGNIIFAVMGLFSLSYCMNDSQSFGHRF